VHTCPLPLFQRLSGTALVTGSSQAIALTSTTTAEGEAARPARPLAIPQPSHPLSAKALAPLRHGVAPHPKPPGDPDVLPPIGGRQHDPGPDDLALLGGRPGQPALPHPPLAARA